MRVRLRDDERIAAASVQAFKLSIGHGGLAQQASESYYILMFLSECYPLVDPPLELALSAGNANARVIRLAMPSTPSHFPISTTTSTQSSSTTKHVPWCEHLPNRDVAPQQ
jgi:hypothetical protein